jgi:SAM-dependent methyltransferase
MTEKPLRAALLQNDPVPSLYSVAELYDAIVQPGPCEAFYREEARRTGGPILELACGTGRLTLPLARDGHEVVGLDASPEMLTAARRKARSQETAVTFLHGDMRSFELGRRFALVVISCNSLAHLTEAEDIRSCLVAIRRHLPSGGCLAFDVVRPDLRLLSRPEGEVRRLDLGPNPSSSIEAEEVASYDPLTQVRTAHWRVRRAGHPVQRMAPLVLRQFFPQELSLLLQVAGFELTARYGDFARNPLTADSLNQICLARPVDD